MRVNLRRVVFGFVLLYGFWLCMMAVHELGHVIAAVITGGRVVDVSIPLVGFSQTIVWPDPQPHMVVWGGPVVGAALPIVLWLGFARTRFGPLLQGFAGWCLIANGAYLGVGWIDHVGDAGDLVRLGTPIWILIVVGATFTVLGLFLWHRVGQPEPGFVAS